VVNILREDAYDTALVSEGFPDRGTDAPQESAKNVWLR